MNIQIHRGLDQIGGCITEISTATSRVFVDMGKNLPGSGRQMSEEEEREYDFDYDAYEDYYDADNN